MEIIKTMLLSAIETLFTGTIPYLIAFVVLTFCALLILRKKKLSLQPKQISIGGTIIGVEEEPVDKIYFLTQPEFDFHIPVRVRDLSIKVADKDGNALSGRMVKVSVKNAKQEEVLQGVLSATSDSTGIASFSGLSILKGGSFKIIAECDGKQCASEHFDIPDITSKVERLSFLKQPESTSGRPALLCEIKIRASNSDGDGLIGRKVQLSVPDSKEESELLGGILEMTTDKDGIARFTNLSISKSGLHQIVATCEDVRCESAEFDVTPPGIDTNFKNKAFGSDEYYESLCLNVYMNNTGDVFTMNGEEL